MKKSLGQHWLIDVHSLSLIVRAAGLQPEDIVLEIGPGSGNLTRLLVAEASEVIAVEIDTDLANNLTKLNHPKLKVINQDILQFDLNQMPAGFKIVANIPYYLTSKLIRQIGETRNRPNLVVMLVQREIAERLAAQPGNLSILGVTCQYFWQVEKLDIITADKFHPAPKVDSQIVRLSPKAPLPLDKAGQVALFQLVRIGFASKRKTLLNNLSNGYKMDKQEIAKLLTNLNIDPSARPQTLSIDNWLSILDSIRGLLN